MSGNPFAGPVADLSENAPWLVSLTDNAGSAMQYTLDGSDPETSATMVTYTGPFALPAGGATVRAVGNLGGGTFTSEASIVFAPCATPTLAATWAAGASVAVTTSCGTSGAQMVYTTDDSLPTAQFVLNGSGEYVLVPINGTLYTGAITLTGPAVLSVVAFLDQSLPSTAGIATYQPVRLRPSRRTARR